MCAVRFSLILHKGFNFSQVVIHFKYLQNAKVKTAVKRECKNCEKLGMLKRSCFFTLALSLSLSSSAIKLMNISLRHHCSKHFQTHFQRVLLSFDSGAMATKSVAF